MAHIRYRVPRHREEEVWVRRFPPSTRNERGRWVAVDPERTRLWVGISNVNNGSFDLEVREGLTIENTIKVFTDVPLFSTREGADTQADADQVEWDGQMWEVAAVKRTGHGAHRGYEAICVRIEGQPSPAVDVPA